MNRDPIGERGGRNLYGFVRNSTVSTYDVLGLVRRGDVEDGRVVYSCNCGWVDTVHAFDAVRNARGILGGVAGQLSGGTGNLTFDIVQRFSGLHFAYDVINIPTTPLTGKDTVEIALGIWMDAQYRFETWQGYVGGAISGSSYDVADLPSDYIAMMIAAADRYPGAEGVAEAQVREQCHFLDTFDSLWVFDFGQGASQNMTYIPEFWRSRPGLEWCWPCQEVWDLQQGRVFPRIPDFFSQYNPAARRSMIQRISMTEFFYLW